MDERTTLEVIAPTVEEALAQGLAQLGLTADAVSVEVVDAGAKGLFGLGGRQVRVRLTVNGPNGLPASRADPAPAVKPESAPAPAPRPARRDESAPAPAEVHDELLDQTEAIVSKLLFHLQLEAQVSAHYSDMDSPERRVINVDVRGRDLSGLIGRHAETLNAFQHVASLMVGKASDQWVQLVVDVEGYRHRREKQLRQMAQRMADQAAKTGRRQVLEPMTAAERRIVHMELRGHPAVTTESIGEEPNRKITIVPKED
jgi:spoIIIJ-associated protein